MLLWMKNLEAGISGAAPDLSASRHWHAPWVAGGHTGDDPRLALLVADVCAPGGQGDAYGLDVVISPELGVSRAQNPDLHERCLVGWTLPRRCRPSSISAGRSGS